MKDIYNFFDVSRNKDFIEGTKSREEIIADFLSGFEGVGSNSDGTISYKEWNNYFTDLGMSIPDDNYFVKMIESTWCVCEDEEAAVPKEYVEHLVKILRDKLRDYSKGAISDEYILR